ncbi:MAG TPA: hypothetical protein VGM93_14530, partial [Acidimicrobiales bacterium]
MDEMTVQPPGSASTEHLAITWAPAIDDDRLVRVRQDIVIHDHGTGEGPALGAALDAQASVDRSDLPEGPPAPTITVELRAFDDPSGVVVHGSWDDRPRPCRRAVLADWVLRMVTRLHLDSAAGGTHLHAAGATDAAGRAVVLMGSSGAGKSTLVSH